MDLVLFPLDYPDCRQPCNYQHRPCDDPFSFLGLAQIHLQQFHLSSQSSVDGLRPDRPTRSGHGQELLEKIQRISETCRRSPGSFPTQALQGIQLPVHPLLLSPQFLPLLVFQPVFSDPLMQIRPHMTARRARSGFLQFCRSHLQQTFDFPPIPPATHFLHLFQLMPHPLLNLRPLYLESP